VYIRPIVFEWWAQKKKAIFRQRNSSGNTPSRQRETAFDKVNEDLYFFFGLRNSPSRSVFSGHDSIWLFISVAAISSCGFTFCYIGGCRKKHRWFHRFKIAVFLQNGNSPATWEVVKVYRKWKLGDYFND